VGLVDSRGMSISGVRLTGALRAALHSVCRAAQHTQQRLASVILLACSSTVELLLQLLLCCPVLLALCAQIGGLPLRLPAALTTPHPVTYTHQTLPTICNV
jgi:hypothetical protein